MKVLLAGGSGAIGLPLIRHLRQAGHEITAIHRSPEGDPPLRAAGASALQVDVLDRPALLKAMTGERFDGVISELTALKKAPLTHRRLTMTDRLRKDGTANLLAAAAATGARRFVTQSMVYGYGFRDFGDRVLTEDDPFAELGEGRFEAHLAAMRSNEAQVLGSDSVEGVALRYGLFYGPGSAGETFASLLRGRRLPAVKGVGAKSLIYIEDAASLTVTALEKAPASQAYNAVDDEPVNFNQFLRTMAAAIGAPQPMRMPAWVFAFTPYAKRAMRGDLRVSNTRAKNELGWSPVAPTYRDGIELFAKGYRSGS
ncbi:MAG: NAD-dependent epimerase/dehydratase family protein [Nitrososphaerales archaeon]